MCMHTHRKTGCIKFTFQVPDSYKTFFIDVMFGVSFSFSEQLWISSTVDFSANEVVLTSGCSGTAVSIVDVGFLSCKLLTTSYSCCLGLRCFLYKIRR